MSFTGSIECRRADECSCITLVGRDCAGEQVRLSLVGTAPADLPVRLDAASVEHLDGERYRISADERVWTLTARAYLHYDLSAAFYRAVPPRPVPLGKRFLLSGVLRAASTRAGQWWLAR
jgi:hypothetical protein